MSEAPILSVRGLVRNYRTGSETLHVLRGVDLDLSPGEVVGLIGPSGCGKSSLLHAVGLLERPDAGEVRIAGRECLSLSDSRRTRIRRREIGFVYQFHHLLAEFSALDNVALPRMVAGGSLKNARAEAQVLLTGLGLGERLTHQPAQLSGGERQRVAIARAIVNRPKVLLADEPTGNLDPHTSEDVFAALMRIVRQERAGALIATHNHELARHMDRVLLIDEGRIRAA